MSRLRELRLHGFKTFADPTRFVFEPGVNAVIGPNGSGKSNMADAVRWVLGEQSNRSLRTRKSDDVIFAGSQQRKPLGMAEAILTLDNADGWLPIEFGEVSIGRRAYRSGESEYLINGARARLRDVVALLGEGRLGANELVVVGQGTVDAALSLRPEERRQLFEEAAGVKNLQVRKNEALSRLGKARDNLTRVNDLVGELKPQVRRLALQAQHQKEHDSLLRSAHGLLDETHHRRERAARERLGEARRAAAAAEAAVDALRSHEQESRRQIERAERDYWQAEESAREAGRHREVRREALIRAESRVETVASRRDELRGVLERGEAELAMVQASLAEPAGEGGVDAELDAVLAQAGTSEREWQSAIADLAAADATLLAAMEALAAARRASGERLGAEARRQEALDAARARRQRLEPELADARRALAAASNEADGVVVSRQAAGAGREANDLALAAATREHASAQSAADAVERALRESAGRTDVLRTELEALEGTAEGNGRLRGLLVAAGWRPLLDAVEAPAEAWPAIEALLGGELGDALLWRDAELDGPLSEADGTARLLRRAGAAPTDRAAALRAVGGERTLADWIGPSDAPEILGRTVVAPDVHALTVGWGQLPLGWFAVTASGDVADSRGVLTLRGRRDVRGGHAARRHARHVELEEALLAAREAHARAGGDSEAAGGRLARAEEQLRAARKAMTDAENAERATSTELATLEARVARAKRRVAELDVELGRARAEETSAAAPPAAEAGAPDLEQLAAAADSARATRDVVARRRDTARAAWSALREEAQAAETASAGRRQAHTRLEARLAQLFADLPAQREGIAGLDDQYRRAAVELDEARRAEQQASNERASADAERERLRAELLELERGIGGETGRLSDLERAAQTAAIDASRLEESLAALAREREMAFDGLPGSDEAPTAANEPVEEGAELRAKVTALDDGTLDDELRRVRRTLGQIGSVNPFAVEEHRELAARLEGLTGQDADLGQAIGSTEELLARLDIEIGERFNAAFAAIGERFDEFCQLLFAGGTASLQMNDGSDGEAPGGIEIVVRPPGKRLQRLAMLSGGERALTGVALLFAMLSVNPVPFCILDEVDAALDEANIGRFADALRKLSESTDFVVITHNRATIEVADTIYGVTMTDAAISRIVSLRLADVALEVPA